MKKHKEKIILFSVGAAGYGLLEILWRGFTHWSMLTAGGICFLFFAKIAEKLKNTGIIIKGIIGSLFITAIELIFGIIFNIILKKNVWDYSKLPLNLGGQICVLYSAIWVIISIVFIPLAGSLSRKIRNSQ